MTDSHEILILYLEDELDEEQRREIEARLRTDAALAADLAELRRSIELLGESVPEEPDVRYWRTFYSRLQPRLERTSFWSKITNLFRANSGRLSQPSMYHWKSSEPQWKPVVTG